VFCPPRVTVQHGDTILLPEGHVLRVAYCVFTPSFSYLENDDVSPDAQNATAMPSATATAMRMTVAITGETALLLCIIDVDIIKYRSLLFYKMIDTDVNEFIKFLYFENAKNSSFACVLSRMRDRYVGAWHPHDRICQEFSVGVEALGLAFRIW
jgi:hypothetical protein